MKRHPLRLLRAAVAGGVAALGPLVLAGLPGACGSTSPPVGAGQSCSLATDCQPGLVCVEQANNTSLCSDDLSRVAGKPPPEGGAPAEAGREAGQDAAAIKETGPADVTPPKDTGPG